MLSVRTINAMSEAEFLRAFGGVYEDSPWTARAAFAHRPFASPQALIASLESAVTTAPREKQDRLLLAHPDLAGKLARAGQLTPASTREQSRLGLNQLSDTEFAEFDRLNRAYRERFGFPFIVCVGLLPDRSQLLSAFHSRLLNSLETERQQALAQVHLIAALRLSALVEGLPPPTPTPH